MLRFNLIETIFYMKFDGKLSEISLISRNVLFKRVHETTNQILNSLLILIYSTFELK